MRFLLPVVLSILIMGTSLSLAQAQGTTTIDPAKKELILKFIDVFGTRKALAENLDLMIKQMPVDQAKEAQQMRERIKVDEIIDELIPVYDHNFTNEELQGLITFYESPLGATLVKKIPQLMRESVEISTKYMESKFPENTPAPNESIAKTDK